MIQKIDHLKNLSFERLIIWLILIRLRSLEEDTEHAQQIVQRISELSMYTGILYKFSTYFRSIYVHRYIVLKYNIHIPELSMYTGI